MGVYPPSFPFLFASFRGFFDHFFRHGSTIVRGSHVFYLFREKCFAVTILPIPFPSVFFRLFRDRTQVLFHRFFRPTRHSHIGKYHGGCFCVHVEGRYHPSVPSIRGGPTFYDLTSLCFRRDNTSTYRDKGNERSHQGFKHTSVIHCVVSISGRVRNINFQFRNRIRSYHRHSSVFFFYRFLPGSFMDRHAMRDANVRMDMPRVYHRGFNGATLSYPHQSIGHGDWFARLSCLLLLGTPLSTP